MEIGEMQKRLIERTQNPLASILVQDAATSVRKLHINLLIEEGSTKEKVKELTERMSSVFGSEEELNKIAKTPEFVSALCLMLYTSIQEFVISKTQDLPN